MDLSSTNSSRLLAVDKGLTWTLGEQREVRQSIVGPGKGHGVSCHISTSVNVPCQGPRVGETSSVLLELRVQMESHPR